MIFLGTIQSKRLNWHPRPRVPGYLNERSGRIPVERVETVFHFVQLPTTPFVWHRMHVPGRPQERSGEVHR